MTRSMPGSRVDPRPASSTSNTPLLLGLALAALLAGGIGWTVWQAGLFSRVRDVRSAIEQGRRHLAQGRPDQAFQALSDIRDDEPRAGEAVTVAAMALLRMGEYRAARLGLERALRLAPDQFEAAVTLAELNVDLGNGRRGAEWFEAAARLRPDDARVWNALARVLFDLDDMAKALEAYEQVERLAPGGKATLIGLVRCRLKLHQPSEAEPAVARLLKAFPEDVESLGLAALAAYERGDLEGAIARADRALARAPGSVDALLARGLARLNRTEWHQALADAGRLLETWPNDLEALRLRQAAETRLGLVAEAEATRRRCRQVQDRHERMSKLSHEVEDHPDDPQYPWKMGMVAFEGGSPRLALNCFEASLSLDPNYRPAREGRESVLNAHPELLRGARLNSTAGRAAGPSLRGGR